MGIGTGVVLLVVGAVLAFAINLPNAVIDLPTIGWILMGGGFVALVVGLVLAFRPKQTTEYISNSLDAQGRTASSRRTSSTRDDR